MENLSFKAFLGTAKVLEDLDSFNGYVLNLIYEIAESKIFNRLGA